MPRRVLLVDDDPLIRAIGTRALEHAGTEVAAVASVAEALPLIGDGQFCTAILDYFLADEECGCDLIAPLRARNPAIRIVVLSGLGALAELVQHAHTAGADLVASKTQVDWLRLARGDLGPPPRAGSLVDLVALRREIIYGAYLVHQRNVSVTARALQIPRSTLQRALRKMGRRPPEPDMEEEENEEDEEEDEDE